MTITNINKGKTNLCKKTQITNNKHFKKFSVCSKKIKF